MTHYKVVKTETTAGHSLKSEEVFSVKEHAIAYYNKEGIRAVTEGLRVLSEHTKGITLSDKDNTLELYFEETE